MDESVITLLRQVPGKVGFYAENLATGETLSFQPQQRLLAASVIKLPLLVECFRQMQAGTLDSGERFVIRRQDKKPSCGALTYMHDGLEVTLEDLYTLMIILSDNTATNLLIDRLTPAAVNRTLESMGFSVTRLNRKLFEPELSARGVENYICAGEIGALLKALYRGEVVDKAASARMLEILKMQRLNGKIPVLLPPGTVVAHKTGEDSGITHDVGIVYGKEDFVLCLCANQVEVGPFERLMQQIARMLYDRWQ
jgi:beta-lactamase class A